MILYGDVTTNADMANAEVFAYDMTAARAEEITRLIRLAQVLKVADPDFHRIQFLDYGFIVFGSSMGGAFTIIATVAGKYLDRHGQEISGATIEQWDDEFEQHFSEIANSVLAFRTASDPLTIIPEDAMERIECPTILVDEASVRWKAILHHYDTEVSSGIFYLGEMEAILSEATGRAINLQVR